MVQPKIGAEEKLQEPNVEEIAIDAVLLRDRVTKSHTAIVHGAVDSVLVKEMGKILAQELHQLPLFAAAGSLSSSTKAESQCPFEFVAAFDGCNSISKRFGGQMDGKAGGFSGDWSSESDMEIGNWTEKLVGEGHGNF